jgi:hypothetical protein
MQFAQNALIKKPGFGHLRQEQVMKQKQDSSDAQSAGIPGENIIEKRESITTYILKCI